MSNTLHVTVTFDANVKTLSFRGHIQDGKIEVPQGLHLIAFYLETEPAGEPAARFPTFPIQWMDGEVQLTQPGGFQVQRYGDFNCTLVDYNTMRDGASRPFYLTVFYRGQLYGSDPTIINLPDDQPEPA